MRRKLSPNREAVRLALAVYAIDEQGRADKNPVHVRDDGTVRGPRGIVNARRLGLSTTRVRRAMPKKHVWRGGERRNACRYATFERMRPAMDVYGCGWLSCCNQEDP